MSSLPSTKRGVESWAPSCTFCDCQLTERLLAIQSYPTAETSLLPNIPQCGGLTLCPDCAVEVVELLIAWQPHEKPPVDEAHSIGDGYQKIAPECSFCTDSCDGDVLGIELYRRIGDELPAYANYTLCTNCQAVFDDFLENVRSE